MRMQKQTAKKKIDHTTKEFCKLKRHKELCPVISVLIGKTAKLGESWCTLYITKKKKASQKWLHLVKKKMHIGFCFIVTYTLSTTIDDV